VREQELIKLLDDMSIMEKIGELNQIPGEYYKETMTATGENTTLNFPKELIKTIGSALNVSDPELIVKIQKEHIENHPHHIPMLFMLDIIHGLDTTFPIPLAQGCSFDPELVKTLSSAAAKEACVSGLHVTFSPMVDLCRDARWGRVMESSGEDTYLNSVMAKAAVEGYQGKDLTEEGTISSCVKHFAAYGAVEGGREYASVDISERNLREYYLPPYKAACDAGSGMLMTSFNTIGGIPSTANKHIMKDILRDEWNYDGVVITDYGSLSNMESHGISEKDDVLSEYAINATVDIEMCIGRYYQGLQKLINEGKISEKQIDDAVLRILKLKNRLGLFENPYRFANSEKAKEICRSKKMMETAYKAVNQTSVLLKNEDKSLPLKKDEKIAFIGPFLDSHDLLGGWPGNLKYRSEDKSVLDIIENDYPDNHYLFAKGCEMLGSEEPMLKRRKLPFEENQNARNEKIDKAIEVAQKADKVVMLLGEHPRVGGEITSKVDIRIPKIQQELFDAVSKVNENVIVVLFNHRPLDITEISGKAKSILDVWFPGSMGAKGIVDMLFGINSPTGRLSMSFPYGVGQEPIYYGLLPTDHSTQVSDTFVTGYIDCPLEPLYSFGEGLTYTDFEYSDFSLNKKTLAENETLTVSVNVKNIGQRDGYETVQLYFRDVFASVSRPTKQLIRFEKVFIKKGETKEVLFYLTTEDFKFYNFDMNYDYEPGEIKIFVGHDSRTNECKSIELM